MAVRRYIQKTQMNGSIYDVDLFAQDERWIEGAAGERLACMPY